MQTDVYVVSDIFIMRGLYPFVIVYRHCVLDDL